MIIIEGMDGSGKTTLAKRLAKDLKIPINHFGAPPQSRVEFVQRCLTSVRLFHHPIIQDRTPFISELMYARISNREPYMKRENAVIAIGASLAVLIYCRPKKPYFKKSSHGLKEYDTSEYAYNLGWYWLEIQADYDTLMASMHAIRYDWTHKNESLVYQRILELSKNRLHK